MTSPNKNIESIYPLSPLQEGMLFHTLYSPDSGVYFVQLTCTLCGNLNISMFKKTWQQVIERHPALRSLFIWERRSKPLQVVLKQVDIPWLEYDWQTLSLKEQEEHLDEFLQKDKDKSFVLEKAPLMRCAIIQTNKETYHFVLSHHHLLMDGWSLSLVFKEFFVIYRAACKGQHFNLEKPYSYRNYILWLKKQDISKAEDFWRHTLKGVKAPTPLVADKTIIPSDQKAIFEEELFHLPAFLTVATKALSRQHRLTLNTLVQGAWALLLSRYSGEDDVIFGATISGRPTELEGMESIVGLFINTLPVRTQISSEITIIHWLEQLQSAQQLIQDHYTFSPLVEIQGWSDIPAGVPLFESIVVFENYLIDSSLKKQKGELVIDQVRAFERTNYPITLIVTPSADDILIKLIYDANRFEEGTIKRMLGHFQVILTGMVTQQEQCLYELPLLSQIEQRQLLIEWNNTQKTYPLDLCLHQYVEAQAEKTPNSCAVVFEDQQLTYQMLNSKANQLAHHLRTLGVKTEVLVGICIERSLEMVIGLLGILKAGAAYVPFDPTYPKVRLSFMLEDSHVSVLLTQKKFVEDLSSFCGSTPTICLDTDWETIAQESSKNLFNGLKPTNLAYVIYTSGSTGKPKGAMNTHLAICNRLLWMQDAYKLSASDAVLQKTSFSFDVSVWEFFWPLMTGARLVIAKPDGHQDSTYLLNLIAEQKITTVHFVPSMLQVFLDTVEIENKFQSLRHVICSGEALTIELQNRFFTRLQKTELHNLYGPTEAAIDVTFWRCQREHQLRAVPIGKPIANTKLYILDSHLQPVPIGVPGELHISGIGLARGYLNRPKLTTEKFIRNPFEVKGKRDSLKGEEGNFSILQSSDNSSRLYKTGDLARYLPDGNIEYLGRIDYQVKIRGFRIELGEIETVLTQHAEVREAVVVEREGSGDKSLVAYVVSSSGKTQQSMSTTLRNFLVDMLPDYMIPSVFVMLDALPLTSNGKVDRRALPELEGERTEPEAAFVTPKTEVEQHVLSVWQKVLQSEKIGIHDNFFELGGHSLLMMRVHSELRSLFKQPLSIVELFQYPTISLLAKHLSLEKDLDSQWKKSENSELANSSTSRDIAIVGISCRFPGAKNVDIFWQNLCDGIESIDFFSDEELLSSGIDPDLLNNPDYVKASATLSDIDLFAADFFDYTPREAEVMDPQQRLFLECAWEAIENSGYDVDRLGVVGVFAGSGMNDYLFNNIYPNPKIIESVGGFQLMLTNDKDFLATRTSHKLNLKGPSINVQTACSTSLVSVHLARQSLVNGECEMALAGGVSIRAKQKEGYLYKEGMVLSPDGHCRAFDAKAQGTVGGNGVGIVVLKRLEDALAVGDNIYAVIKNSAINNDGAMKVGFTAPSVDGQASVITDAMQNIDYESISYIETHGTGTTLGDPIEIAALTQAYQSHTHKKGYCAIGSVKSNVGHLDTAAGVASLIKTVLALKHKVIPPSLHFEQANPKIDFADTPFFVNSTLSNWQSTDGIARRAGVSSFGIGGTNVHVVLEEAPAVVSLENSRDWQLVVLSAKTDSALETTTLNLAEYLQQHTDINFCDMAYTLSQGSKIFNHRRILVCQTLDDVINKLNSCEDVFTQIEETKERSVVFMFSGQGSQYVNMALELYQHESIFHEHVDKCADILKSLFNLDLRTILYPGADQLIEAEEQLKQTAIAQPALFVVEYALAKLWMAWGVCPVAMIGHSIGEYVAACLAGVFSLEEALSLVATRGHMMQKLPGGAMLSVSLSETELNSYLNQELSLAAVNAPSLCVVSGTVSAITDLENQFNAQNIDYQRLHTSHAFHSEMMEPIFEPFTSLVKKITLNPPQIPYLSNLTGTWITETQATDPSYWSKHLRQTVRFAEGLQKLLKQPEYALLEIGPGRTLTTLVRQHSDKATEQVVLSSVRHPKDHQHDVSFLLTTLGKLWLSGVSIDWTGFYANEQCRRLPLPTYPFERQRYWIDPPDKTVVEKPKKPEQKSGLLSDKKPDIADWFYLPSWKRSVRKTPKLLETSGVYTWLVFVDEYGLGSQLVKCLRQHDNDVITVRIGTSFTQLSERNFRLNPAQQEDYDALFNSMDKAPENIVCFWPVFPINSRNPSYSKIENLCFYSLLFLVKALGDHGITNEIVISVISNNMQQVAGETVLCSEKTTLLGLVKVIGQEYQNITCRSIDVVLPESDTWQEIKLIDQLFLELITKVSDSMIAYRDNHRWVQTFEPIHLESPTTLIRERGGLRKNGVYLITGGLGGIGLVLAEHLAKTVQAKLILIGRSTFPVKDEWADWIASHDKNNAISQKIKKIQILETLGAKVWIASADVANLQQMQEVTGFAQERFGQIHGIIHAAGVPCGGVIQNKTRTMAEPILATKVQGTKILVKLFEKTPIDFIMLCSSISSIRGDFGQVDYCAANAFMDAFTHQLHQEGILSICINWDTWQEVGMAANADLPPQLQMLHAENLRSGILPSEGVEVFDRILANALPQVVVSTRDLDLRFLADEPGLDGEHSEFKTRKSNKRQGLQNAYVAPTNEIEQTLADIWKELLGIEPIGISDDFFELGGHSLLATQVISRMHDAFGIVLPLPVFFESTIIAKIAEIVVVKQLEKMDKGTMEQILVEIDDLSDDDVKQQLSVETGLNPGRYDLHE